jgi:neutral ceramidase
MENLVFGFSEAEITPEQNISLGGYGSVYWFGFGHDGVNDDIYVKALSIKNKKVAYPRGELLAPPDDTADEVMLITLDNVGINYFQSSAIREAVSRSTGIPKTHIMIACSHTHGGPELYIEEDIALEMKYDLETVEQFEKYLEPYYRYLEATIIRICNEAHRQNHVGTLYSTTFSARLGYNRRYIQKSPEGRPFSSSLYNLWMDTTKEPNGIIDPDIPVLMIERQKGDHEDDYLVPSGISRIIIFSVPYDAVVFAPLNRVNADYPGAARSCLEDIFGQGTKTLYLAGASGDTHPMISTQYNPKAVEIVGRAIGYGIAVALAKRKQVDIDGIDAVEDEYFDPDYTPLNRKEVTEMAEKLQARGSMKNKLLFDLDPVGKIVVQVFKIGQAAIAAASAECFTKLGIEVRKNLPYQQTLIASNANGRNAYLPVPEAYDEGGYEITVSRGFSRMSLMNVIDLLIKHGTVLYNRRQNQ